MEYDVYISENPNLTMDIVLNHPDYNWNYILLIRNPHVVKNIADAKYFCGRINRNILSDVIPNPNLSWTDIKQNFDVKRNSYYLNLEKAVEENPHITLSVLLGDNDLMHHYRSFGLNPNFTFNPNYDCTPSSYHQRLYPFSNNYVGFERYLALKLLVDKTDITPNYQTTFVMYNGGTLNYNLNIEFLTSISDFFDILFNSSHMTQRINVIELPRYTIQQLEIVLQVIYDFKVLTPQQYNEVVDLLDFFQIYVDLWSDVHYPTCKEVTNMLF